MFVSRFHRNTFNIDFNLGTTRFTLKVKKWYLLWVRLDTVYIMMEALCNHSIWSKSVEVAYFFIGFERKGGSAGFLDLLLYQLYACAPWFGVLGEKVQRHASKFLQIHFLSNQNDIKKEVCDDILLMFSKYLTKIMVIGINVLYNKNIFMKYEHHSLVRGTYFIWI